MKISLPYKSIIVEIISYLYILLFVYAAASKLLDFESFEIQLGQSPILGAFASPLALAIPLLEIGIAVLLMTRRFQFIGLLSSLALMTIFTVYIIIILNWSYFIPCSCGGILEKMGWSEHLAFNIFFIVLALIALVLQYEDNKVFHKSTHFFSKLASSPKRFGLSIFLIMAVSILSVIGLNITAESTVQRNNAFQRRYPPHQVSLLNAKDLVYEAYYLAGLSGGKIYLGNSTAPLHGLMIDTLLQNTVPLKFRLKELAPKNYTYLQFRVIDSSFFLTERSIPAIFKGTIGDWTATEIEGQIIPFSLIEPISPYSLVLKTIDTRTNEDELAVIRFDKNPRSYINPNLLTKQIDGVFDTDGKLLYNRELKTIIYPYYYRNQYIIASQNADFKATGNTIDTVKTATLKIATDHSKNKTTIAGIPLTVNADAATSGNYLFIKSTRLGKLEPEKTLKKASIIDVYNLLDNTYAFSFHLYNYNNEDVISFAVYNDFLVTLTKHYIVTYRINTNKYFESFSGHQ